MPQKLERCRPWQQSKKLLFKERGFGRDTEEDSNRHEMKRYKNLYKLIVSPENLDMAERNARKDKGKQIGVREFNKNRQENLDQLHEELTNKTYKISKYRNFTVFEPKEREISSLPYRDRVVQHAVVLVMERIWTPTLTADTYSSIKGRGVFKASYALRKVLRDVEATKYCLKLDIKKFYPNVDHDKLKSIIRRKIKDNDLLWLLDLIIDSAPGLPIGNYLSQPFSNLYLSGFDHWLKEKRGVKCLFRYCDDIVTLAGDKPSLHALLAEMRQYLRVNLLLEIKRNYQIFEVAERGIDFLGMVHYPDHVMLRKRIKKNMFKKLSKKPKQQTVAAYNGYMAHCDSKHLQLAIMKKYSDLGIRVPKYFCGVKVDLRALENCEIEVLKCKIKKSRRDKEEKCLHIDFNYKGSNYIAFTTSEQLIETARLIKEDDFPFTATLVKDEFKRFAFQ